MYKQLLRSIFAAAPCFVATLAQASPVVFHASGTIDGASLVDVAPLESIDFAPIPVQSPFSVCFSYDTATAPVFTSGQFAQYDLATTGKLRVETVAGTFAGRSDPFGIFAQVSRGEYSMDGFDIGAQPLDMPAGWSDPNPAASSYFVVRIFNPTTTATLGSTALPASLGLAPFSIRELVLDFLGGVAYPGGVQSRRLQVHGTVDSLTSGPGSCDPIDSDHDGVPDPADACPGTVTGPVNASGCSVSDLSPCNAAWKNHGAYVASIAHTVDAFVSAGLLTRAQGDTLVSQASHSGCGH
jgi:hypothetical protein